MIGLESAITPSTPNTILRQFADGEAASSPLGRADTLGTPQVVALASLASPSFAKRTALREYAHGFAQQMVKRKGKPSAGGANGMQATEAVFAAKECVPGPLVALPASKKDPGTVKEEKAQILKDVELAAKNMIEELKRSGATERLMHQPLPVKQRHIKGRNELQSLLNGWESSAPKVLGENAPKTKRKRAAALEAAVAVRRAMETVEDPSDIPRKTPKARKTKVQKPAPIPVSIRKAPAPIPGPEATPDEAADLRNLPPDIIQRIIEIFYNSGDKRWAVRNVLRTGLLAGQEVEYRKGVNEQPLLGGTMTEEGTVRCMCSKCKGQQTISCMLFEDHAGVACRTPTDSIFLKALNMSIREFIYQTVGEELPQTVAQSQRQTPRTVERPDSELQSRRMRTPVNYALMEEPSKAAISDRAPARPALSGGSGRVVMMAPKAPTKKAQSDKSRNSTKNKRLFIAGSGSELRDGEEVSYIDRGVAILKGVIVMDPDAVSGILCNCCSTIISASSFEAHAGKGARRAPYDFIHTSKGETLREIAARMPDDLDYASMNQTACYGSKRSFRRRKPGTEEFGEPMVLGGCCICNQTDFNSDGFDDRTIIICDQCELEHHVGCLRHAGRCDLQALPEGDWFCSQGCRLVRDVLALRVEMGLQDVPNDPRKLQWQLLRNKDQTVDMKAELDVIQSILQESFDPIMDMNTNTDLLPIMVASESYGEWDYSGMHCLLLKMEDEPVAAAIIRVFGQRLAELPLIATKPTMRRQGLCRKILDAITQVLAAGGVSRLCLPAARETVYTWKAGFGFVSMPEPDAEWATAELRMLRFPGTELLQREIIPGAFQTPLRPDGWIHPSKRTPPADEAAAGEAKSGDQADKSDPVNTVNATEPVAVVSGM